MKVSMSPAGMVIGRTKTSRATEETVASGSGSAASRRSRVGWLPSARTPQAVRGRSNRRRNTKAV